MADAKIWTTERLCAAVISAKKCRNNNQLAKVLGVDRSTVTLWVHGGRIMSDDMGARCASIIGADVGQVLCGLALERVKDDKLAQEMRRFLLAATSAAAAAVAGLCVAFWHVAGGLPMA